MTMGQPPCNPQIARPTLPALVSAGDGAMPVPAKCQQVDVSGVFEGSCTPELVERCRLVQWPKRGHDTAVSRFKK